MMLTLNEFLASLPELVGGIENVVVATYNHLHSYDPGERVTASGRKITILRGNAAYAEVEKLVTTQAAANLLVVLYVGTRFARVAPLAQRLTDLGAKIALVSCGCDGNVFGGFEPGKNVLLVVPTHSHCNGGKGDLSRIIERLL